MRRILYMWINLCVVPLTSESKTTSDSNWKMIRQGKARAGKDYFRQFQTFQICLHYWVCFFLIRKRRKMRIRQAAATKEHQAVVNAVGRFMKVYFYWWISFLLIFFTNNFSSNLRCYLPLWEITHPEKY